MLLSFPVLSQLASLSEVDLAYSTSIGFASSVSPQVIVQVSYLVG